MLYAEGDNYRIELDGRDPIAHCSVWRRPDLDSAAGARCAREIAERLRSLALDPAGPRALLFDLRVAPPVTGPQTEAALGEMFALWERASKRVAVVVGDGVQQLQMRRVVRANAPKRGDVFTDMAIATASASQAPSSKRL